MTKHKRIDMLGQTFGLLTVREFAGRAEHSGHYRWHCRCKCGNEATVDGYKLRQGATKSCGCLRSGGTSWTSAERALPTNSRVKPGGAFGMLTAVERIGADSSHRSIWRLSCECGGERFARDCSLTSGDLRSCGCVSGSRGPGQPFMALVAELLRKAGREVPAWVLTAAEPKGTAGKPGAAPVAAPVATRKPAAPVVDLGPWKTAKGVAHMTPPAEPATGRNVVRVARTLGRYEVDPASVQPLFSAMKPGQYLGSGKA